MNKRRYVKTGFAVLSMAVMMLFAVSVYGGSSLLTPGTSTITAGSSFDFTLNTGSLGSSGSETEDAVSEYVIALSVSPSPESLSVKEGCGSINAVTGEYQVTSSQLGSTEVLHFTVTAPSDLTSETTYTVSVAVTGSVEASDSFSLIAVPAQTESGDEDSGSDSSQSEEIPGNTPDAMHKTEMKGKSGSHKAGSAAGSSSAASNLTYAGSWDNYLDSLSVSGYDFTRKFNKTRDTYFLSIPYDVTSLSVSAVPCDSSASVVVTGSSNIPEGSSKIMISVTADDGSVRIYRIYVNRSEGESNV